MGRWAYIVSLTLLLIAQASLPLEQARAQANVRDANVQESAANEARALLDAGELAYAQGRFGDALDSFEASYRKRREAQTLRRIGDAADKLGSHARAIEALKSYLARVPDARDRVFVESRIAANQAELDAVRRQTLVAASSAHGRTDSSEPKHAEATTAAPAAALSQTKSEASGNRAGPFWLWAAGGAVVVAGIVVAAVVISSGASPSTSEPVRGNIGSAIQTLSSR